jgi:hypothetical protein
MTPAKRRATRQAKLNTTMVDGTTPEHVREWMVLVEETIRELEGVPFAEDEEEVPTKPGGRRTIPPPKFRR